MSFISLKRWLKRHLFAALKVLKSGHRQLKLAPKCYFVTFYRNPLLCAKFHYKLLLHASLLEHRTFEKDSI